MTAPTAGRTTIHLVPHTHWDREWYEPFQTFRMRLVELVDHVLDLLDAEPSFRFTNDLGHAYTFTHRAGSCSRRRRGRCAGICSLAGSTRGLPGRPGPD